MVSVCVATERIGTWNECWTHRRRYMRLSPCQSLSVCSSTSLHTVAFLPLGVTLEFPWTCP